VVESLRNKMRALQLIPPKFVDSGPVLENRLIGEAIDITKFPSPRHHELDGGRYIGTGHTIILRDPDTGWLNLGTYRSMFVDRTVSPSMRWKANMAQSFATSIFQGERSCP